MLAHMALQPFAIAEPLQLEPTDAARAELTAGQHVTLRVLALAWDDSTERLNYLVLGEGLTQPRWVDATQVVRVQHAGPWGARGVERLSRRDRY
jgi:hypothetical protein